MADVSKTRPHTIDLVEEILSGTLPPSEAQKLLAIQDRKGLTPITFAVLSTARDARNLVSRLDQPTEVEQTQLSQIVGLLEQIAAAQIRLEESQTRIEHSQVCQERALQQIVFALGARPRSSPKRSNVDPARSRT